jgi:hypothetical protein
MKQLEGYVFELFYGIQYYHLVVYIIEKIYSSIIMFILVIITL